MPIRIRNKSTGYDRRRAQRRRKSTVAPGRRIPVETSRNPRVGADRGGYAREKYGKAYRSYVNDPDRHNVKKYNAVLGTLAASEREHRKATSRDTRARQQANAAKRRKAKTRRAAGSKRRRR